MDSAKPVHLNFPNFDKVVNQSTILVDFWAEWCGPCKVQNEILEEIIGELNDDVIIGKVNVDDNRILANKYRIMNIPTMILFRHGEKLYQFSGIQSKERINTILNKYL